MNGINETELKHLERVSALHQRPVDTLRQKWDDTCASMSTVPTYKTMRDLKMVLFLSPKVEELLLSAMPHKGHEATLASLNEVEDIKTKARLMLGALRG